MVEDIKNTDQLPPEVLEAMRALVAAIRAVKIYPSNNPIYSQAVTKAYDALNRCLQSEEPFSVGVQKTYFLHGQVPVGKDTQMNKAVAQDLFAKGIREVVFTPGIDESELLALLKGLALSSEEMAMRSGIVSILWENGATHIRVAEAELDEVIVADTEEAVAQHILAEKEQLPLPPEDAARSFSFAGRTLVLGDLIRDPKAFSQMMIEAAKATAGENESVQDRLYELYKQFGTKVDEELGGQSEAVYQGLARSVMEMDPTFRDHLVNARLYADLDAENAQEMRTEIQAEVPHHLHEIMTGRFNKEWTVEQVATLLKKSLLRTTDFAPVSPADVVPEAIPADMGQIARELSEYTAKEMEELRVIGESGMEADIIEGAVRTLLFLLPLAKNPHRNASEEKDAELFNGIVRQLELMLTYLLSQKDYRFASIIVRALHEVPVTPEHQGRLREAFEAASSRDTIMLAVGDIRANAKDSELHADAFAVLKIMTKEATPVLLEILSNEQDRSTRFFLMEIIKDLGKGQTSVVAQGLGDNRWYVVRNVVNILAESRSEEAIPFLEKVLNHRNVHVRQEVVKGLSTIGGRRAASLIARYLKDKDSGIQFMAMRSLGTLRDAGEDEATQLTEYLQDRRITKNREENNITIDAIRIVGKLGGRDAYSFLERYDRIRWWKARRPQEEVRAAAIEAREEIMRRLGNDSK
jgi:HEAT repeat protein